MSKKISKESVAVVILAAGRGRRMKSDLPKVMHTLGGAPLLSHVVRVAESLKPQKIIVVLAPGMDIAEREVAPHEVAIQKEANGTGGALKAAMPALKGFKGDVVVLLGDVPLISAKTVKALIAARHEDSQTGISVLGVEMKDPTGYGRLITKRDGTVIKIVEEKDAAPKEKMIDLVNTGAFCIDGARLESWIKKIGNKNAQGEYYITDLPQIAVDDGVLTKAAVTYDTEEVKGCNSRADLAALEAVFQARMREAALVKGVTLVDPGSVYFSYDTKIAADVLIEPQVFFGCGVEIETGAHIKAFSHIEGSHIGSGAVVGPFARLRPGTELAEDVRIGNFVEIKKSKIGKRSKISHLGYVGDCTMGEDVNFSAGAITVNYDGFEKHETKIGKNVMVGSNVNLVAPISIDDGAFIAAGSTITEDVPADSLSIARDVHKIREGWAAEYRKKKQAIIKKLASKKKKKAS